MNEADEVERDIIQENQPRGIRSRHPTVGNVVMPNFSYEEQCSNYSALDNMFEDLRRCRFGGLCSYNGRNGNLWTYDNYSWSHGAYCIQADGTPIYSELNGFVLYFDYYTTDVTEDYFVVPEPCGCVIDWDY